MSLGPSGRADFPLAFTGANQSIDIENAQHVQAVILGGSQAGAFSLTNGMAWIP
jgi:hypothetical protein